MTSVITRSAFVPPIVDLVGWLRPYASLVLLVAFVGFFVAASVAVLFSNRRYVRPTFVVGLFAGVLLFNFVVPTAPYPFVSWAHFSEPTPAVVEHNEIRIVDETGRELLLDDRATLEFDAVAVHVLARRMLHDYSERRNEAVARHLVHEARDYRERIEDPPWTDRLRYPHHGFTTVWTRDVLEEYDEFVGVRIYRMTFVTNDDGTEVTAYEEALLLELYPLGETPSAPPIPNESPPDELNRTAPRTEPTTSSRT